MAVEKANTAMSKVVFKGIRILFGMEKPESTWPKIEGIPDRTRIKVRRREDEWVRLFIRHEGKTQMGFIEICPDGVWRFRPIAVNACSVATRKPISYMMTEEEK